jgi:hypothetical protein
MSPMVGAGHGIESRLEAIVEVSAPHESETGS